MVVSQSLRLYGAFACLSLGLPAQNSFAALEAQAKQARDSNRLDEAVVLYKKAVAARPGWAEGWWNLGTLLYDRDAYADSANALQKAVELSPRTGVAFAMLGLCEAKLGRNSDALQHLETARKLGFGENENAALRRVVLYTQGTLLLAAGEFGQAQDTLDVLAHEGVEEEELILALGRSVLGIPEAGALDNESTREIVRRAGWAEHFAAMKDIPAAMREYGNLAADAPKFHNVQFAYGRFLLASNEDEKAVEAFQREIENTPKHLLARLGIAGTKLVTDPAAGLPYAEQAVKLAPKLPEAHYLLGGILLATGDAERAIRELETAAETAPNEPKIYFALGRAYTLANRKEDAARARATFKRLVSTPAEQSSRETDEKRP